MEVCLENNPNAFAMQDGHQAKCWLHHEECEVEPEGSIPGMTQPLLTTQNLTKHFQLSSNALVQAVDDISLEIAPREILGLVGESGSGKSTFGKTVIGLHDKTSGTVDVQRRGDAGSLSGWGFPAIREPDANDLSGSVFVLKPTNDSG